MRQVDFHLMAFFVCLLSSLAFQMLKKKQIVTFWFIKASIYFYLFSSYSIRLGTCVLNRFQVSQNNAVQDILTKLEVIIHRLEVLLSSETLTITKQNCAKKILDILLLQKRQLLVFCCALSRLFSAWQCWSILYRRRWGHSGRGNRDLWRVFEQVMHRLAMSSSCIEYCRLWRVFPHLLNCRF